MRTIFTWLIAACAAMAWPGAGDPGGSTARAQDFSSQGEPKHLVLVCGGEEVLLVRMPGQTRRWTTKSPKIIWTWRARKQKGLPYRLKNRFKMISECKLLGDGKRIFITAKEGGVALVNRVTDKVEFTMLMKTRPYSADLLPNDRIVIVGGTDEKEGALCVHDLNDPDVPVCLTHLPSGHAVHWDEKAERLWAVGWGTLRTYKLENWLTSSPKLKLYKSYELPGFSGHDLAPKPNSDEFYMTHDDGVWLFDRGKGAFRPHPVLGSEKYLKSISVHPKTGLMLYVQPQDVTWWTNRVKLYGSRREIFLPGHKVYKARWLVER